jgi:hypothetical protein
LPRAPLEVQGRHVVDDHIHDVHGVNASAWRTRLSKGAVWPPEDFDKVALDSIMGRRVYPDCRPER